MARAIEESAQRLGVETIDLYFLHGVDPRVDVRESLQPIFQARHSGRIRWIGLSNVSLREAERALAEGPIDAIQNRLSVTVRPPDSDEMLGFCEAQRIRFIAYTPFGPRLNEGDRHRVRDAGHVRRIAAAHGVSPEVVALAWLLARSPQLMVIPGARRPEAIRESMSAIGLQLDEREIAELSGVASHL